MVRLRLRVFIGNRNRHSKAVLCVCVCVCVCVRACVCACVAGERICGPDVFVQVSEPSHGRVDVVERLVVTRT